MNREFDTIQLLRSWHCGDREALDELIRRNLPWIKEHVHRRLGQHMRRAGDTQDFVQEAMVRVLEYGPKFEVADEDRFRRLVARIVENSLRHQHRHMHQERRDVRRERPIASDTILSLDPPQKDVTRPSEHATQDEKLAWVRLALELLTPQDRDVLWLREYEQLSFKEVAERLDTAEDAVRQRFHRALPRLARKVAELQQGRLGEMLAE